MKKDCLFYVASPYSHPIDVVRYARFRDVCRFCAEMMSHDFHVFSPIAHTHPIAEQGEMPTGFEYWRKHDEIMMSRCDAMIVLEMDGHMDSVGVQAEIKFAREHSMPIFRAPGVMSDWPVWMIEFRAAMEATTAPAKRDVGVASLYEMSEIWHKLNMEMTSEERSRFNEFFLQLYLKADRVRDLTRCCWLPAELAMPRLEAASEFADAVVKIVCDVPTMSE